MPKPLAADVVVKIEAAFDAGRAPAEVAAELGVDKGTVKSRFKRIKKVRAAGSGPIATASPTSSSPASGTSAGGPQSPPRAPDAAAARRAAGLDPAATNEGTQEAAVTEVTPEQVLALCEQVVAMGATAVASFTKVPQDHPAVAKAARLEANEKAVLRMFAPGTARRLPTIVAAMDSASPYILAGCLLFFTYSKFKELKRVGLELRAERAASTYGGVRADASRAATVEPEPVGDPSANGHAAGFSS